MDTTTSNFTEVNVGDVFIMDLKRYTVTSVGLDGFVCNIEDSCHSQQVNGWVSYTYYRYKQSTRNFINLTERGDL